MSFPWAILRVLVAHLPAIEFRFESVALARVFVVDLFPPFGALPLGV